MTMKKSMRKQSLIGKVFNMNMVIALISIVVTCANLILLYQMIFLYYGYNYSDNLYGFMYPNWVLLLNSLFGVLGIFAPYLFYKKRINILYYSIITIVLWFMIILFLWNFAWISIHSSVYVMWKIVSCPDMGWLFCNLICLLPWYGIRNYSISGYLFICFCINTERICAWYFS